MGDVIPLDREGRARRRREVHAVRREDREHLHKEAHAIVDLLQITAQVSNVACQRFAELRGLDPEEMRELFREMVSGELDGGDGCACPAPPACR